MNSKRTRKKYNKNSKILIIMVLMVGVIGLSIGFSAFSNNLNINSTATVNPSPSNFKVLFSTSPTSVIDGPITSNWYRGGEPNGTAIIDNNDPLHPKITSIKATIKGIPAEIVYQFYVRNEGSYTAYLKNITIGNKLCTAKEGTSQALVDEACNYISPNIGIVEDVKNNIYSVSTNISQKIDKHPLKKGSYEIVRVWISDYNGLHLADEDFDVDFGDITLTYSTSDA